MNVVLTVAEIVAPVFMLAGLGFAWVKLGYEYRVAFVTQLAMTLAVPCLIFTALMQSEVDPFALSAVSLAAISVYGAITIVFWGFVRFAGIDRRTYLAPLIFGNTGNLGLPLALFAFGDVGLDYAVVIFAIMGIYSFTFGVWLVSGGGSLLALVKEPLVGATLLGALFLWQDLETPKFLTNALTLIGQLAIPLMLITLGVGLAAIFGLWFQLDEVAFAVLVLQVGTPVAVTSYLLAEKYGADAEAVAGLVVVSTLMSVGILPLILVFLI